MKDHSIARPKCKIVNTETDYGVRIEGVYYRLSGRAYECPVFFTWQRRQWAWFTSYWQGVLDDELLNTPVLLS
jgi:hypothetical protein